MKQAKNDALAAAKDFPSIDVADMKTIIGEDLNRAEVGMFCMLRAGVGLLVYKELSEHGEWEERLMELCPDKSPRTLQMYMKQARELCDSRDVSPAQAWAEARKIDASNLGAIMLAAPDALQIGEGAKAGEPPAKRQKRGGKAQRADDSGMAPLPAFSQMLLDFIQQRKRAKKPEAPAKPLTKREKVEAAICEANRVVNLAADWVADGTWALLPDDELESTMAGLRAAADKLREEYRKRSKN